MTPNTTRFRIELSLGRWNIIDPLTGREVSHSATWEGAVTAAKEIENSQLTPVADANLATRSFRETLRVGHLGKVLAERFRRQVNV